MGIFGKLTSRGDDGLTFLDRAAIFAKAAEGDTETAMAYRGSIADRMKRQQQQEFMAQLAGRLGPQYAPTNNELMVGLGGEGNASTWSPEASINPVRTSAGLSINDPDLPAMALQASQMGLNLGGLLDVLKAQAPEIDYNPSGEAYNRRTGALTGSVAPKVGEGMMVQRGPGGVLSGIANAPGYVSAASEAAGSIEGAKEGAKAAFDLVDVPVGDTTVKLPRSLALQLTTGAFARENPGAMGGNLPAEFGRSAPQAQLAADRMRAEAQAQGQIEAPAALQTAQQTLDLINQIRNHPGRALGTGATGVLPGIPGTTQQDFITLLDQAKGAAFLEAFGALKGGGAITEREGQAATAAIARLNRTQSEEGFMQALADLERVVQTGMDRVQRKAQGGVGSRPSAPATQGRGYRILSVE